MMRNLRLGLLTAGAFGALACFNEPNAPLDPGLDPRIQWITHLTAGTYYGSPALSADHATVYVGTSQPLLGAVPRQNVLVALAVATGAQQWSFPLGLAEMRSTPAVHTDGSITFLIEERNISGGFLKTEVVRVSSSGSELWRRPLGIPAARVDIGFSAPAVGADGSVFIAADSLYALNNDGTVRWTAFGASEDLRATPTIGADGTVYFAARNVPLSALDPATGNVLWDVDLGSNGHVFGAPALGADGTIYVATEACVLHAVSAAGTSQWSFDAKVGGSACAMRGSPAVAADGTIYVGTTDRVPRPVMYAVRPNGTVRWTFLPPDLSVEISAANSDIFSSPALGNDGTLFFGHEAQRLYAVSAEGGGLRYAVRTETITQIVWSSPVITSTGTLLISDVTGRVYAITTESGGLQAAAPWPRFRGGNQSAGRR
jgi:outer membrane protein assembly factor BamB